MTATKSKSKLGIVWSKQIGTCREQGTDWPVEHMVRRCGRTYYLDRRVIRGICHGGTLGFRTKAAAIAAAD